MADLLLDAGEQRLASIEAHSPALLEKGNRARNAVGGKRGASERRTESEEVLDLVDPTLL